MADADVQGLLIRIEATTAQLRQELAAGESAVAKAASQIDRSLGNADSSFDRLGKKAQATTSLIRGAMAGIAGAGLIGGLIKQADAYGQMADRMRAATSSSAEYEMVQKHILTTAQETYRPLHEAQELYIRTADVMKGLGYNTQQTLNITDSFSYLLVTNSASADKAGTALDAYSKSLHTGKIDADSWVSIMTAMPTVAEAVATATGKTSKEIRKLGAEGKLGLSDLNRGLEQVRDSAQKAAAQMSTSVMDALNNINNAIGAYIGKANESTSATGELAKVLDLVAKNIDIVAAAGAGLVAAGVTGYMLKNSVAAWNSVTAMVAEAKATRDAAAAKVEATAASAALAAVQATETSAVVVGARSTEASAIAKLRVIQVARDQLAYTVALSKGTQEEARYTAALAATDIELAAAKKAAFAASAQLGAALTAESAAMAKDAAATTAASVAKKEYAAVSSLAARAGSGLLALLGGPVGIAALAVGAGVAFLTMRDSTDEATKSIIDMQQPLDDVAAKFKQLTRDQQAAEQVQVGKNQAEAIREQAAAYADFLKLLRQNFGSDLFLRLKADIDAAYESGVPLIDVIEDLKKRFQIPKSVTDSWVEQAGKVSTASEKTSFLTGVLDTLTDALRQNTAETNTNNTAKAGMSAAGTTYLEALQKQLAGLQDGGDATKIASRYIKEHSDLTETDKVAILSAANAIEANKEATKRATAAKKTDTGAAKEAATEAKNQAKALTDLQAQADIAIKSAVGLAAAYLAGTDKSREFSLQQKVDEALLKTGSAARDEVIAKLTAQQDAQDKLNVSKSAYDLGKETSDIIAQAQATLMGADALAAYNVQKAMTVALAGRNIEVGSKEYQLLLDQTKAQLDANKALEQAGKVEGIVDRLNPQIKLLRDYTDEQDALNAAIARYPEKADIYRDSLTKLGLEYEQNKAAATVWGQFTQGAVDRVDEAFADAWKNIDKGFSGFASSLKDGFKQLLAELAHMAITKPIIMQIGASLGVGGLSAQSSGLFGGSSGGGTDIFSLAKGANQLYSVANSGFGQAISSGWASGDGLFGGLQNAFSGGYGYVGSALGFGSGAAGAAASSGLAQGAAAYGSQFGTGIGTVSFPGAASGAAGGAASGAASAGLSGLGAAGYGIGGAIAGYQQAGVKGAVTGAGGAVAGAYAGAAIGSVVPIIGTAIGAAIGAVLGGMLGSSVWGGDWVTKDQGIQLGVTDNQFVGKQFEYQKKKGGLFSSNKKRTRLSALDPEMQAALDSTYDATEGSVLSLFDRLNVELSDGVLDGLNVASTNISTKGKTGDEIQEAIAKWFGGVADSMVSTIDAATGAGLGGYNFESLTVFVNNLYSVNDVLKNLNVGLFDFSVSGGFMAENLSALAGGLDALTASASTYYDNFFSDAEKAEDTLEAVGKQFAAINMALPSSRQAYRDIIEALDVTTEAGRTMFATLTSLAGSAAQAYTILEQQLTNAATNAQGAVQRAISAQQKRATEAYNATNTSLNDMVSTVTENVSGLNSVSNDLGAALKALRGDSDDAVKMLRAQAQATLQSALATARSGGSLSGFSGLSDALDTVSSNNTDLYGSMEDFARDQGRTANVVAELNAINGKQLTSAEASLAGLKTQIDLAKAAYDAQMAQFDSQLAFAQAQMDALNGVDNSVMGVTAAINAMNASVVAALGAIGGKASAGTAANNGTLVDSVYKDLLGREADAGGKAYWERQLASGAIGYDQLAQATANAAKENGQAVKAGYATGGLISGPGTGTSDSIIARLSNGEYVMRADAVRMFGTGLLDQMNAGQLPAFAMGGGIGETGPQLEVTGPSRIFNANQTASMLRGGGDSGATAEEVRALRRDIESNATYMAKLTKAVADGIDTLVNSGVQINGTVETKAVA